LGILRSAQDDTDSRKVSTQQLRTEVWAPIED